MLYWIIFCIDRYFALHNKNKRDITDDDNDDEHGEGVEDGGLRDDRV